MADPLLADARELLGPGISPVPRLFVPIVDGGGLTIADRYRNARNLLATEVAVRKDMASLAESDVNMMGAARDMQVMRQEPAALQELQALDPLDSSFRDKVAKFQSLAAVSAPVSRALDLKMGVRQEMDKAMTAFQLAAEDARLSPDVANEQLRTAEQLLRAGNTQAFTKMLAGTSRLAAEQKEKEAFELDETRARSRFEWQQKSAEAQEDRLLARAEKAMAETKDRGEKEKAQKDFLSFVESLQDLSEKIPYDLRDNDPEMQAFLSPFSDSGAVEVSTPMTIAEALQRGITPEELKKLGVSSQDVPSDTVMVPVRVNPVQGALNKVVETRLSGYLEKKEQPFGVFPALQTAVANNQVDRFKSKFTNDLLSMSEDAFVSSYMGGLEPGYGEILKGASPERLEDFLRWVHSDAQSILTFSERKNKFRRTHPKVFEAAKAEAEKASQQPPSKEQDVQAPRGSQPTAEELARQIMDSVGL